MTAERVAGLVLAGGLGRRHSGADKGWMDFRGRPLVEHALQHLQDCETRIISANRNLQRYRALGVDVVVDRREGFLGPLSGIESVFLASDVQWLYVLPVDLLGMPGDWRQQLFTRVGECRMPWCGTLDAERLQPLLGLWSRQLLPELSAYLDDGGRRVMQFVRPWQGCALPLPVGCQLHNLNTPQQLLAPHPDTSEST